jgi:predicted nucleic acid-binding protein
VNLFFCDASALGKRYAPEVGTALVNRLFAAVSHDRFVMLTQALGETLSILVRRRNKSELSPDAYQHAAQSLRTELIVAGQVRLRTTDDTLVFASLPLVERHSINSTDALVLAAAIDLSSSLAAAGHALVLVTSDTRLVRAGTQEALAVFNPETDALARLEALLAS